MTLDADPAALQGAIAAGVLGCGTVILGAADLCRKLIEDVLARADACRSLEVAALAVAREHRKEGKPLPGYGHPLHKPLDPRAERMVALAGGAASPGARLRRPSRSPKRRLRSGASRCQCTSR